MDLCSTSETSPAALRRARALWRRVRARPVVLDALVHDAEVAFSSHLPQLLALALAGVLSARGIARRRLGPGGAEMTRLAGSSAEMWTAILDENSAQVTEAIDTCQAALGALRGAVARRDRQAIHAVFDEAHHWMATAPDAARTRA